MASDNETPWTKAGAPLPSGRAADVFDQGDGTVLRRYRSDHLDLHPMNVMISPTGPVIIDWTNACRGAPAFDAAMSYILMSSFEVGGLKDKVGQKILVTTFARGRGRSEIDSQLRAAAAMRLEDPNMTDGEKSAILKLLEK